MHRLIAWLTNGLENCFKNLLVCHFFKNTVTSHQNKIVAVNNFEASYFWSCNNNICFPTIPSIFGFNISYRSRYRQTSRVNSMRARKRLSPRRVSRRRVRNKAKVLIHLSSIFFNSLGLIWVLRFMIAT